VDDVVVEMREGKFLVAKAIIRTKADEVRSVPAKEHVQYTEDATAEKSPDCNLKSFQVPEDKGRDMMIQGSDSAVLENNLFQTTRCSTLSNHKSKSTRAVSVATLGNEIL